MRLKCEVDVVVRPVAGCSFRKASRPHQAIITVGKEGTTQGNNVRVTMLISSNKNRQGTKYQLSRNITQLHARFVEEGKGTICLHEPAQDICIKKADPLQLKSLLSLLRLVTKGEDISKCALFTAVTPPSSSGMKALQTTMVITKRQDYPLTSSFPSALKSLTVKGVSMKRLDPRIQDLRHLQTLSLAFNLLTSFPDSPGKWRCLSELDLSANQLPVLPPVLYRSCIKDTLTVLKLDNNKLTDLPLHVGQIKGLVRLHVDDNSITALPPNIGSLSRLYVLSAERNKLSRLPASIARLRLQSLHLFGNPLQPVAHNTLLSSSLGIPSLKELASRFIKTQGLTYSEEDLLPGLIYYLDNARQCVCGKYCFESCARFLRKCDMHQLSETVHGWNTQGSTTVPVETFLCSTPCLTRFNHNPDRF